MESSPHSHSVFCWQGIFFDKFVIQAGADFSEVATDLAMMNATVKFIFRNTASFFGVHVTSTPLRLSYSQLTLASGTPRDKPDIKIYVLAEESRTMNSYVSEICSSNREGKNNAVALDEVIAWTTEKQLVLSLRPVGFSHLLGILMEVENMDGDNKDEGILQGSSE
ncbi:hypothetical protein SDJN02_26840, partial [Cucurbita argyrosperma subsp. argyrosperma]